jgi:kumamolisin
MVEPSSRASAMISLLRVEQRARRPVALVALVVALTSLALSGVAAGDPPPSGPVTCDQAPPQGLTPAQAGDRYDLTRLWQAGHTGQGVRVALIEIGTAVNAGVLADYEQCIGVVPVPFHATQVDTGPLPPPSGESMSDAEMIVGLAPGIERLDEFYSSSGVTPLLTFLQQALDPANTGGRLTDIISISFNTCEKEYVDKYGSTKPTDDLLQWAAEHGVWVVKGAGDSGSSACAAKEDCTNQDTELAVDYPASSPWVTSLGGIMVDSSTADRVTDLGITWKDQAPRCGGTGGGVSTLFDAPDWQKTVPGNLANPKRIVPDVASLAGNPGYQLLKPEGGGATWVWAPTIGDSMTGPLHAAGFAAVRSALVSQGIAPPAPLNPELYRIANSARYTEVFRDVTHGDNDAHDVGCCSARQGYDQNTGLGQLQLTELALALGFRFPVPAPVVGTPAFTG